MPETSKKQLLPGSLTELRPPNVILLPLVSVFLIESSDFYALFVFLGNRQFGGSGLKEKFCAVCVKLSTNTANI